MPPRYVVGNYISSATPLFASSEDAEYVLENLYIARPSKPFRFTGQGSIGNPEWVCVDLLSARNVTYCGIFNHNLTMLEAVGDELRYKACSGGCPGQSGACADWDIPDCERDLAMRLRENFKNACRAITCGSLQYVRIDVIDQNNPSAVQFGEIVLGQHQSFTTADCAVYLQPGRGDGPLFYMAKNDTHYGQTWNAYFSQSNRFSIKLKNINNPDAIDEMHAFLMNIHENYGGRFVFIPDDERPFCYYVVVENTKNFADRLIYGSDVELREWRLELKSLTEGINLL